jgi:biotin transport system substrate-specific component
MNYLLNSGATMESQLWPKDNNVIKQALLILAGVLILACASQLSIPLEPIPLTFQSSTVILIGMMYGARNGCYVVMAYLLAGLCGLPLFANFSSGLSVFYGSSAGYLLGFLPAAFVSGYLTQRGWAHTFLSSLAVACLGVSIIFSLGITVLTQFIGFKSAVAFGLAPFILSEWIKLMAVSFIVPKVWKKQ